MFGVLLESRSRRQRRTGGVVLSVVTHVTIIGFVTAVTARGTPAPHEREKPVIVHFTPPPPPQRRVERTETVHEQTTHSITAGPPITITTVVAPTVMPLTLPPIDLSHGVSPDSIVVGAASSTSRSGYPSRSLDLSHDDASDAWRGADLVTRITASFKPRYPESLRAAGIDGRVVVRFVVDTIGKIDPATVEVISSTHELFTTAVKDALRGFRFKPAESGGHRVRMLAEMPFEFSIGR